MVLGVWQNWESLNVGEAFLVALIAIVIVFLVLAIIIFITWAMQKGMEKIDASTNILPKEENKILSEDQNAVVAALVASMEFYRETGKEVRIVSIKRIAEIFNKEKMDFKWSKDFFKGRFSWFSYR